MNRYHCLIILPEGTKDVTIEADTMNVMSTCATSFSKRKEYINEFGMRSINFEVIAQYPTERLIIESVDWDIIL